MEVMEEGNLMDRVPILLQRDLQYYQGIVLKFSPNAELQMALRPLNAVVVPDEHQCVLQEPICTGVVGGKLDFPRYASFASIKIVNWWEDEYLAAYKKHSGLLKMKTDVAESSISDGQELGPGVIVKSSDPEKFVSLVTKSADQLLEHLHSLSQESLDHADLTVLTATIGATALIKNCLWVYLQSVTKNICPPRGDDKGGALKLSYKQYSEMTEALAERLLDLHCRLLTLYIVQDADCLHWESPQPFFESERGSYTVQMWWLYMQGTKDDLWNSVPPKMAQRVFAGMLNETLTVMTVRYTQTAPSQARSQLLLVDVCNILYCVTEILPCISEHGEALVGLNLNNQSKIIRDIHAKCQELFACLLLRGAPLGVLFKLLRKGTRTMDLFSSRQGLPSPWIVFTLPKLFPIHQSGQWASRCSELPTSTAISLELKVLLSAPQSNWSFLLKVLLMRDATIASIILHHLMKNLPSSDNFKSSLTQPLAEHDKKIVCDAFLCSGECFNMSQITSGELDPIGQMNYQIVLALTYVLIGCGKPSDIKTSLISTLDKCQIPNWADCLDKRQVWDQKRPPWFEAILHFVYPVLDCIIQMLVNAVETNASMYQAMSLAITCLSEMWDCIPEGLYKVANLLADVLPVTVKPLGDSVLIQILFSALYTKLLEAIEKEEKSAGDDKTAAVAKIEIYQTLAEAICSIDEDNKHTEQINMFLKQAKETSNLPSLIDLSNKTGLSAISTVKIDDIEDGLHESSSSGSTNEFDVESAEYISELLASDILTSNVGKHSLRLCYNYLKNNKEWLLQQLGVSEVEASEFQSLPGQNIKYEQESLLKTMFHIGHIPFDQLLTGGLRIDYMSWLQTPMSITPERAWLQVAQRCEFQENAKISIHETAMVAFIANHLKP